MEGGGEGAELVAWDEGRESLKTSFENLLKMILQTHSASPCDLVEQLFRCVYLIFNKMARITVEQ